LSAGAKALAGFFNGVTNPTEAISALKTAETSMIGATGDLQPNLTIGAFYNNMDTQTKAIVTTIRAGLTGDDLNKFNDLLDVYQQGNYLITRDWRTEGGVPNNTVEEYKTAAGRAGVDVHNSSAYDTRGNLIPLGGSDSLEIQLDGRIEYPSTIENSVRTKMAEHIITALGVTNDDKAKAMADALINQFQDVKELEAFVDDVTAKGFNNVLNYTDYPKLAQAAPQSIRLASVNAEFPLDAIKYGDRGVGYTGSFTPLQRRDEEKLA
jgi:hypothetical protein